MSIQPRVAPPPATLSGTLPLGLPAVLYGVRLWVAVSLSLFLAFRLQLDNPGWAGTSAAIVCQPAVGAALRKGWARMVGTTIGAIAIVLITIIFPQDRVGFLSSLILWVAACGVLATLLHNFLSYMGALAGFTAAIIAADILGATGGAHNTVLQMGISRTTEILLGIVCGSGVLAATDFGMARAHLSELLESLATRALAGLRRALAPRVDADAERLERRRMLSSVAGISVVIEQAAGEISALPFRPRVLQRSIDGLYATVSAWRVVATHREANPATTSEDAARLLACIPERLAHETEQTDRPIDPMLLRSDCLKAVRRMVALPVETPSGRLLADATARALLEAWQTLGGIARLQGVPGFFARPRRVRITVPDYLPPLLNGVRALLMMAFAEWLWIATAWPNGSVMIVWASALVILMAPLNEAASLAAWGFLLGALLSTVLAAVIVFAVLPQRSGFLELAAVLGLVLIPIGTLSAQAWRQPLFVAAGITFSSLVSPSNFQTYDPATFYNNALALVFGVGLSLLALRLMPPLSPAYRARRLLALTLRDLRRLTCGPRPAPVRTWRRRAVTRMGTLTDGMDLLQHARMSAAFAVGNAILRLRRLATPLHLEADLEPVLRDLRRGNSRGAIAALAALDAVLQAAYTDAGEGHARRVLRARAEAAELADALRLHTSYFDANPVT